MIASRPQKACSFGFLTVIEVAEQGLIGGYLLLNRAGRPLEFHCTTPVRANRAQEILYGVTLRPYLYGEQIGKTLLARSKATPVIVYTDVEHALAVQEHASTPVVYVADPESEAVSNGSSLLKFSLGEQTVAVSTDRPDDKPKVVELWSSHCGGLDLLEPFERIQEAIKEAQSR